MGCFAEIPWLIRVIRLRCTKSCVRILAAVAGFHLLISQHLFKLLEASFAAVDFFRLCCAPLTLLPQVDRLTQSFLLIILREHFTNCVLTTCAASVRIEEGAPTVLDAYSSVGFESLGRFCQLHLMVSILQSIAIYCCFHSQSISPRRSS